VQKEPVFSSKDWDLRKNTVFYKKIKEKLILKINLILIINALVVDVFLYIRMCKKKKL